MSAIPAASAFSVSRVNDFDPLSPSALPDFVDPYRIVFPLTTGATERPPGNKSSALTNETPAGNSTVHS
ncbi:hypothetical protein DQG23_09995 [Paenibacillus contaminans]|uniref:Uncharacterized protein n=1 Tax=Paenibacillus contaminans TaxID=450362 RepID=A0A329MPQ4_9BACL|nr:hypothetical protein DQG23_09995 [Paenibacillus contaminans]